MGISHIYSLTQCLSVFCILRPTSGLESLVWTLHILSYSYLHSLPQNLKQGMTSQVKSCPVPSSYFTVHCSLIISLLDAVKKLRF
jgi:hypothetical protein